MRLYDGRPELLCGFVIGVATCALLLEGRRLRRWASSFRWSKKEDLRLPHDWKPERR